MFTHQETVRNGAFAPLLRKFLRMKTQSLRFWGRGPDKFHSRGVASSQACMCSIGGRLSLFVCGWSGLRDDGVDSTLERTGRLLMVVVGTLVSGW